MHICSVLHIFTSISLVGNSFSVFLENEPLIYTEDITLRAFPVLDIELYYDTELHIAKRVK